MKEKKIIKKISAVILWVYMSKLYINLPSFLKNPLKRTKIAVRYSTILSIIVIIILSPFIYTGLFKPKNTLASWAPGFENWMKRKQLNITNDSDATVHTNATIAITVDTKALYDMGYLQDDCDDLRILYQTDSNDIELTRHLVYPSGTTCSTSTTTKVYFPLQADLSTGSSSNYYYMYYKNSDASTPSDTDNAFDIDDAEALLVCPFNGTTTCVAGEEPSSESGAIRYSGEKSALSFDGVNDTLNAGSDSSLDDLPDGGQITIEFWYKPGNKEDSYWKEIIAKTSNINTHGWDIRRPNKTSLAFAVRPYGTSGYLDCRSKTTAGNWYHVAAVYDDTGVVFGDKKPRMYLNGSDISSTCNTWSEATGSYVTDASDDLKIMHSDYTDTVIDEVRVSNIVRYTSNFTPQTSPFIRDDYTKLLLHFDENGDDPRNSGKTIDDSGNNNHGTITGAKYVAGLVGVDASSSDTGNINTQSYAGQQGILIEESRTNYITNPSFENDTYNLNWTAGANNTVTDNTSAPYYKFGSHSAKIVNTTVADSFDIPAAVGSTYASVLSAYVYNGTSGSIGGTVDSTVAKLVFNGTAQTTNYRDIGGGWWQLSVRGFPGDNVTYASINQDSDQGLYTSDSNEYLSQGFTVPNDGNIDYISLFLKKFGSGTPTTTRYRIEIQTDSGGVPSGTAITNGTSGCRAISTTTSYVDHTFSTYFTFSSNPSVSASTQYHLVLKPYTNSTCTTAQSVADSTNYVSWGYDNSSSSYANGDRATYNGSTWSTQSAQDHIFYLGIYNSQNYGVEIQANKTIYVDGVQLEKNQVSNREDMSGILYNGYDMFTQPTTYLDGSLGTNYAWNGTAHNSTSYRYTSLNNAYLTYGVTDNFNQSLFSISLWVKPALDYRKANINGWSYTSTLFKGFYQTCGSTNVVISVKSANGTSANLTVTSGSASRTYSIATDWTNTWHHIVYTYESGGNHTLFVDGVQRSQAAAGTLSYSLTSLLVGGAGACDPGTANAQLSDLRIYNDELSSTEVADLYYSGLVSHSEETAVDRFGDDAENPIAVYHFDEGSGSYAYDSSTNSNDLTVTNAVWDSGTGYTAMQFDGDGDYLSRSQDSDYDFGTGSFSISGIFKHSDSISAQETILSKYGTSGYKIYLNASGYLCFGIDSDSTWSPTDEACSTVSYADNSWHHFEAVKDGVSSITLYIDGHQVGQDSSITSSNLSSSSTFYVGVDSDGTSNDFTGYLDELIFYPYARSVDQIYTDQEGGQISKVLGDTLNYNLTPSIKTSDPLVYLKFDEGYGQSPNNSGSAGATFNGILGASTDVSTDDPTWINTGKSGKALSFDGGDFVQVPHDASQQFGTGDFTLSAWIKGTSNNNNAIIGKYGGSGDDYWLGTISSGKATFSISGNYINESESTILDDNWHHVLGTRISGTTYIYVDGQLRNSESNTNSASPTGYLGIGKFGSGAGLNWNGSIDEPKVYNVGLTANQVKIEYNLGKSQVLGSISTDASGNASWSSDRSYCPPGDTTASCAPVAEWKLDEGSWTNDCSTSTVFDSSGNGSHGTACPNSTGPTGGAKGVHGNAGYFDGSNDYLNFGDPSYLDITGNISISLWVKRTGDCMSYRRPLGKGIWPNEDFKFIYNDTCDSLRFSATIEGTSYTINSTPGIFEQDKWYHIVGIRSDDILREYVNGVYVSSWAATSGNLDTDGGNFIIGGRAAVSGAGDLFNGYIDDVKIYDYALSPAQVAWEYSQGAPLVHYRFDECSGTTLNNAAPSASGGDSGNDATIYPQSNVNTSATSCTSGLSTDMWYNGASGKFSSSLDFDGDDDYAATGNAAIVAYNAKTYTNASWGGWFKPSSATSSDTLIHKGNEFKLTTDADGKPVCSIYYSSAWHVIATGSTALTTDSWSNVICTFNSTLGSAIHVNGRSTGTGSDSNSITSSSSTALNIARDSADSGYFDGQIDEINIWAYDLTSQQVKSAYNQSSAIKF